MMRIFGESQHLLLSLNEAFTKKIARKKNNTDFGNFQILICPVGGLALRSEAFHGGWSKTWTTKGFPKKNRKIHPTPLENGHEPQAI